MSKNICIGLIPVVALVLMWAPAAQAQTWTCGDLLEDCLYWANQDTDNRMRDLRREQCYADYDACESSPVCGDGICQSWEDDDGTCPMDCGAGIRSNEPGTVERNYSSSVLSTDSD
jgi:hypothetical protein